MKSRQTWGASRWGWVVSYTCSVWVLDEMQTEDRYCAQTPTIRRKDAARQTKSRKPKDSNTQHWESVPEPHTCPLTTIARIHSKCQEANISSRIWFLSQLSSQGPGLGSLWINYSEIFSLQSREMKMEVLKHTWMFCNWVLILGQYN